MCVRLVTCLKLVAGWEKILVASVRVQHAQARPSTLVQSLAYETVTEIKYSITLTQARPSTLVQSLAYETDRDLVQCNTDTVTANQTLVQNLADYYIKLAERDYVECITDIVTANQTLVQSLAYETLWPRLSTVQHFHSNGQPDSCPKSRLWDFVTEIK